MISDHQKREIVGHLLAYIEQYPSQKKAAESLQNVAEATLINMKNSVWKSISDEMWRNVGQQVGYSRKGAWELVPTRGFNTLQHLFKDAQEFSNVFAIVAPAGTGKTATARHYAQNNRNVYHITCAEYFNRKVFLGKLLERMGKDNTGYNVNEMMDYIVELLRKKETPLLIIDEADKLPDAVLYFFITLYNMLEGKCAIVLMATEHLSKRILRGCKLNRKGYAEIYSRIGRRFISIGEISKKEIEQICSVNGVEDRGEISEIYNQCDGDLRRVERGVHRYQQMQARKTQQVPA